MPLYEYRCKDCGHEFEELVSFSKADHVVCEKCGSEHTERLMSTFCGGGGGGDNDGVPSCSSSG